MLPVKSNSSVQSTPCILYLPDINVLKLFGKNGLKIMTQLINNIHETGERTNNFLKVTMIALKRKPETTKCSNNQSA